MKLPKNQSLKDVLILALFVAVVIGAVRFVATRLPSPLNKISVLF